MAKWNLSNAEAQAREAAFEARALAELAQTNPRPPPAADGIQISHTAYGQTTTYENLAAVPLPLRQRIMATWVTPTPPALPPLPAESRPRSRRAAIVMNLFFPGAGQFYNGQPAWGTVYALSFLACFLPMLGLMIRALQTALSGEILDAGRLEQIAEILQPGRMAILGTLQFLIVTASIVHLFRSRTRV